MKRAFVKTKNVARFIGGIEAVRDRADGIESLMLAMGARGSGKTRVGIWLLAHDQNAMYIRARAAYGDRIGWFLRDLCRELGLYPSRTIEQIYRQVVDGFRSRPKTFVIIDEIGRLASSGRILEVIKDIHDETSTPFIFMGEPGADRLLSRFPSILDRITQIVVFDPLDGEDIFLIAKSLFELPIENDAIQSFSELIEARFRSAVVGLYRLEKWSRDMGIDVVTAEHVQKIFSGKGRISRPKIGKIVSAA